MPFTITITIHLDDDPIADDDVTADDVEAVLSALTPTTDVAEPSSISDVHEQMLTAANLRMRIIAMNDTDRAAYDVTLPTLSGGS